MIPFLDLAAANAELRGEIDHAIRSVLDSGWYVGGRTLQEFQDEFAAYCGARFAVGTANGLDALSLSLRAFDIGIGDEVITVGHTFIASWLAVSSVGAKVVPIEPCKHTMNLDPTRIEAAITPRTRAIMPVHLYGQPANLTAIRDIAKRRNLFVIEDAAQAHGATWHGKKIGSGSDAICWSFYPGKNLGAIGDGGCVTTDNPKTADRIKRLGNYGSVEKYFNEEQGVNSRLDPLQAAVLSVKLSKLDEWNARRAQCAAIYFEMLSDLPSVKLPCISPGASSAWHLFVVRHPDRNTFAQRLKERGISTLVHYPKPPHLQKAYRCLGYRSGDLPITEKLANEVLSLPIGPHLTKDDCRRVAETVREVA